MNHWRWGIVDRDDFFGDGEQMFNLFVIDGNLATRSDGAVDGGAQDVEEKLSIETGVIPVFQSSTKDNPLYDGEAFTVFVPAV